MGRWKRLRAGRLDWQLCGGPVTRLTPAQVARKLRRLRAEMAPDRVKKSDLSSAPGIVRIIVNRAETREQGVMQANGLMDELKCISGDVAMRQVAAQTDILAQLGAQLRETPRSYRDTARSLCGVYADIHTATRELLSGIKESREVTDIGEGKAVKRLETELGKLPREVDLGASFDAAQTGKVQSGRNADAAVTSNACFLCRKTFEIGEYAWKPPCNCVANYHMSCLSSHWAETVSTQATWSNAKPVCPRSRDCRGKRESGALSFRVVGGVGANFARAAEPEVPVAASEALLEGI